MPDFAIGNANWPDIDLSRLDTGRSALPANGWQINPAAVAA